MKQCLLLILLFLIPACVSHQPASSAQPETPVRPAGVSILSRPQWSAAAPVAEMKPHDPSRITIHHTATPQKPERTLEQKMQALQQFSQSEGKLASGKTKPPWPDVPYHFYIDVQGRIAEGRPVQFVGDTNTEYDPTGHILVVLEGNFEIEQPTPEQRLSLTALLRSLTDRFKIAPSEIRSHNDFAKTACPGRNLKTLLPGIRDDI